MLLQVTHFMDYPALNTDILNVYDFSDSPTYGATAIPATNDALTAFATAFWKRFLSVGMRSTQHTSLLNVFVRVSIMDTVNAGLSVDYTIPTAEQAGTDNTASERLAPFIAAGVRFQRPNALMRHGFKRFTIPNEGAISAETTSGTYRTTIMAWCNSLVSSPITLSESGIPAFAGNNSSGRYVLVRRVVSGQLLATPRIAVPSGALFLGATTQNTRKLGRGS